MTAIAPDTTVSHLLEHHPDLRKVLQAHGIDTCCGGALTLAQAADVRDVDLGVLLAALSAALPRPAAPAAIGPGDTVRAVIARHPHLVAVFERHGLMGCGGAAGPDERIDIFATVHRIPVDGLLAELNAARETPPQATTAEDASTAEEVPLYPRFLKFALVSTLLGGAAFGAYNLAVIHFALGVNPPSHNAFHATFQLFGFMLMAIMGVSYHAFPRLVGGTLRHREIASATFGAMAAGVLLRGYGQFGAMLPGTRTATVLGAVALLAGVLGWALCIVTTCRAARPAADPFLRFVTAGTAWWVIGAAVVAWAALSTFLAEDPEAHAVWNEAFYVAALLGGTLGWVKGMLWRTGPVLVGLREPAPRLATWTFSFGQLGTVVAFLGACLPYGPTATVLYNAGLAVVALAFGGHLLGLGLFRAPDMAETGAARTLWILRAGAVMGLLFSVLAIAHAGMELGGSGAPKLLHDGARHALGLGFLTLVVFGMAGRILPVFAGTKLRLPRLHLTGAALVLLAALLRQAEVVAGLGGPPELLRLSGASGFVALAGVLACVASLLATLGARQPAGLAATPVGRELPITPYANVAELVAAHPAALPVLIEAGFTPLANPLLRRTLARAVTLGQACRMHHIDVEALVDRLRSTVAASEGKTR